MLDAAVFDAVAERARTFFEKARGSHDWSHTMRVLRLAEHIGRVMDADLDTVRLAALLHDIGRPAEDAASGGICHAEHGAGLAGPILRESGISDDRVGAVQNCIRSHRFRNSRDPGSLEASVLYDADKLDSIGAAGIARAFLFAGEVGATVHNPEADILNTQAYSTDDTAFREYMVKLRHVKDRLYTDEGRRLAAERDRFMVAFFERLDREITGEV